MSLTFDPQVADGVCEDGGDDDTAVLLTDTDKHTLSLQAGCVVLCSVVLCCVTDRLTTAD